jgi:hypothetical protein
MDSNTSLICFKAISNFTTELGETFSRQHRPLKLYKRLINQTTLTHEQAIQNHIDAFRKFCVENRDAIAKKDHNSVLNPKISYSQRVYIDMSEIFKLADKETTPIIWQHLLCISAIVDPAGKAKEILKENLEAGKTGGTETNFLTDIIDKVESHVDPNANPMEAVSSIMQSGIFTDLIGGMNQGLSDGSLDIGKLMGAVQGMVGKLDQGNGAGSDPQTANAMNMISSMMGNMGNNQGDGGDVPDLAGLMQGMMGSLSSSQNTPNDNTDLSLEN